MSTSTYAGFAGLLVALYIWFRKSKVSTAPLPPGPKPLPVLGNIRDLTSKELWLPATQWAKEYGERLYLPRQIVLGGVSSYFLIGDVVYIHILIYHCPIRAVRANGSLHSGLRYAL